MKSVQHLTTSYDQKSPKMKTQNFQVNQTSSKKEKHFAKAKWHQISTKDGKFWARIGDLNKIHKTII